MRRYCVISRTKPRGCKWFVGLLSAHVSNPSETARPLEMHSLQGCMFGVFPYRSKSDHGLQFSPTCERGLFWFQFAKPHVIIGCGLLHPREVILIPLGVHLTAVSSSLDCSSHFGQSASQVANRLNLLVALKPILRNSRDRGSFGFSGLRSRTAPFIRHSMVPAFFVP